jgi:hypothetical protein
MSRRRQLLAPVAGAKGDLAATHDPVEATPGASDQAIAARLKRILDATGWFTDPEVRVDEGVVFLTGGVRRRAVCPRLLKMRRPLHQRTKKGRGRFGAEPRPLLL